MEGKPSRVLDLRVAIEVLGLEVAKSADEEGVPLIRLRPGAAPVSLPRYTTDIRAAAHVVVAMAADHWTLSLEETRDETKAWIAEFVHPDRPFKATVEEETEAMAICLAALKVLEIR